MFRVPPPPAPPLLPPPPQPTPAIAMPNSSMLASAFQRRRRIPGIIRNTHPSAAPLPAITLLMLLTRRKCAPGVVCAEAATVVIVMTAVPVPPLVSVTLAGSIL